MSADKYMIPKEKVNQLKELLSKHEMDALLVFAREGSDKILPFLIGEDSIHCCAALFYKDGQNVMLCSSSDKGNYAQAGVFTELIDYGSNMAQALKTQLEKRPINRLALNVSETHNTCDGLTQGLYLQLELILGKERLRAIEVSSAPVLLELRSKKTVKEIETLKEAIKITQRIYDEVMAQTKCGMTEREIGDLFSEGLRKYDVTNGTSGGYAHPIVCLSRAGLAHRAPGHTKSQPGDVLIMDFSVRYKGYCSDIARSAYFLEEGQTAPPADIQHVFDTAYAAISAAIEAIKPGVPGYEIDNAGRKVIEAGGYPTVRHSVGHQIGIECHDGGTGLSTKRPSSEAGVQVGECYAVEPTVIQDNGLTCMIVEENVVVTETGAELLSVRQEQLYLIK